MPAAGHLVEAHKRFHVDSQSTMGELESIFGHFVSTSIPGTACIRGRPMLLFVDQMRADFFKPLLTIAQSGGNLVSNFGQTARRIKTQKQNFTPKDRMKVSRP